MVANVSQTAAARNRPGAALLATAAGSAKPVVKLSHEAATRHRRA
jgi:hypothetical protein